MSPEVTRALARALEVSNEALIAERAAFYDGATKPNGEFSFPEDAEVIAEFDALIDANNAALEAYRAAANPKENDHAIRDH